jgi:RNA polymerase-binding transcription factor DksA
MPDWISVALYGGTSGELAVPPALQLQMALPLFFTSHGAVLPSPQREYLPAGSEVIASSSPLSYEYLLLSLNHLRLKTLRYAWRSWQQVGNRHKVRGVPAKKIAQKLLKKVKPAAKKAAPAKKAPAKKAVAKKAVAKKAAPAKKAPAKKAASIKKVIAKKSVAKKAAPAKKITEVKKSTGRPFPSKVGKTTLTVDEKSQTVSVATVVAPMAAPVVEERRLVMPPPPRPVKSGKKVAPLKPLKAAPTPVTADAGEAAWNTAELKAIRTELSKELIRLQSELAAIEAEMDELIADAGDGAGDDQADSGTKTFEREHEMSLVINARDMVLQTERALSRIDNKTYGNCEVCGSPIGKARLQVFPRATLCMICKQKEERR